MTALSNKAVQPFQWSEASASRNRITDLYEPIQPWVFLGAVDVLGAQTVFDVGANIGYYSLVSTLASDVSKVVGFEAAPVAAMEFRKNVELNSLSDLISIEELAVSDCVGEAEFLICSDLSGINALADSTMHRRSKYQETPLKVPTVSLDSWCATHELPPGPIGLKVDVEGSEGAVFRGAAGVLANREIVLQVEMYETNRQEDAAMLEELGLELLLRCDNDWFWTNSLELVARWREVVELAMTNCVRAHLSQWPPARASQPVAELSG